MMNRDEKHVLNYLKYSGYTNIVFEPDGNVPPDFIVNGTIAVEVRRLNQNYFAGSNAKGLEEVGITLLKQIKNLTTNLGPPVQGESWYVFYRFKRPVVSWKILEPKLLEGLQNFKASPVKHGGIIAKIRGFEFRVFKAGRPHATMFVLGGNSDEDSGGLLISIMEKNINHCVSEKTRKIAKVRSNYGQWWLALVDYIGYTLDDFDRKQFKKQVLIKHNWNKIILIDPGDHTRSFEI